MGALDDKLITNDAVNKWLKELSLKQIQKIIVPFFFWWHDIYAKKLILLILKQLHLFMKTTMMVGVAPWALSIASAKVYMGGILLTTST